MKQIKIAIHLRENSFSERWIEYCDLHKISYIIVNVFDTNIIEKLLKESVTHFMWHINHSSQKDLMLYPYLMNSLDDIGIKTFPNFNTRWHFDDKVAQKYLLESINAPLVPSFVFYTEREALEHIKHIEFPIVAKLKRGAGASNVKLLRDKEQAEEYIKIMFSVGINPNAAALVNLDAKVRIAKKIKNPIQLFKKVLNHFKKTKNERKVNSNEKGYFYYQEFLPNNDYDTRVIVAGGRAFAVRRFNRKNDFRASGSGNSDYDTNNIDMMLIKLSFVISKKLKMQSVAFDFVYDQNMEPKIVEVCFGFNVKFYDPCPGYWDSNLNYIEGSFNPQYFMIDGFLK